MRKIPGGGHSGRTAQARAELETLERRRLLSAVYVDDDAPGPSYDGTSWQHAFRSLPAAMSVAQPGDVIRVAGGTYRPTPTNNRSISIQLRSGIEVLGGYAGNANQSSPDSRDTAAYRSILSGDIGIPGDDSDNSYHVVVASAVDATGILDGFVITGGNADASPDHVTGGGMLIRNASPTVRNCTFSNNIACDAGGGLAIATASPALTDCVFETNVARRGGGIYAATGSPTLTRCDFVGNAAAQYGVIQAECAGGAAYFNACSPMLDACGFIANSAFDGGAIVFFGAGSPAVAGSTFADNTATQGRGGAVLMDGAARPRLEGCDLTANFARDGAGVYIATEAVAALAGCTLERNAASHNGGGVFSIGDGSQIADCRIVGNRAALYGGGVYSMWKSVSLANCPIVGNTGGGVYNDGGSMTLMNCALVGNVGGGAFMYGWPHTQSLLLANCVAWANSGFQIQGYGQDATPTVRFSDVQGGYAGQGNIDADPLFVRQPGAGPDNRWGTADDDYGNLRPQAGSAVVDAGRNADVPPWITTDLAGGPRLMDLGSAPDTGDGVAPIVDMGVYEAGVHVAFISTSQTVAEAATIVTITVEFSDAPNAQASIPIQLGGTAHRGDDYSAEDFILFPAGSTTAQYAVQIAADTAYEPEETITMTLLPSPYGSPAEPAVHTITITDNDPPAIQPVGDRTIEELSELSFRVLCDDYAAPGRSVEFALVSPPAGASISPDGLFTWTPSASQGPAQYQLTVRASRIGNPPVYSTQKFRVQVTGPDATPQASAGGPYSVAERGSITLAGSATAGPGRTIAAYEWDLDYDGVTFDVDASIDGPVFSAAAIDGPATRTVALRARDDLNVQSRIVTATISIANLAPYVGMAGPTSGVEGGPLAFNIVVTDVAGDTHTFQWQVVREGQIIAEAAGRSFTFTPNDDGLCSVKVTVWDDDGSATEAVRQVSVANVPPTMTVLAPASVATGEQYLLDLGDIVDPGAEAVAGIIVNWGDGQIETFSATGVQAHLYPPQYADYAASVTIIDEDGQYPVWSGSVSVTPQPGTISGMVFDDADEDGLQDVGEPSLAKATVYIDTNRNGKFNKREPKAVTDAAGRYAFANVPPGQHQVRLKMPKQYRPSATGLAFSDIALADDGYITDRNFAITRRAIVTGRIFFDRDWNGRITLGEPMMSDWQVFDDLDNDGVLDAGEQVATTAADGAYELKLLPGRHRLVVVLPPNGFCIKPRYGILKLKLGAGKVLNGKDFGVGW